MKWISPHGRDASQNRRVRPQLEKLEDRTVPSAVVVEVPNSGVWRYESATGWQQLTPADASEVAVDSQGNVAAEIPGYGVWRYENAVGWQQLTPADAALIAINAGNVAVDITSNGVWRFENATGWKELSPADPIEMQMDAAGDVVEDVSGHGVWRFQDAIGWQQLSTVDVFSLAVSDSGVIAAGINEAGVWRFENATGWKQLETGQVESVGVDNAGDVSITQNAVLLYHASSGSWQEVSTDTSDQVPLFGMASDGTMGLVDNTGRVFTLGLTSGTWQLLTPANPNLFDIA